MKITRENYEPWFLDYIEGNLEEGMIIEFIRFISENPDLKEELHLFEPVIIEKPNISFPGKEKLFKEKFDWSELFDETAVALLAGDLDPASAASFNEYLQKHPEKNREIELFYLTKLKPDLNFNYHSKKKLYHTSVVRIYTSRALRIAAILALALVLFPLPEKKPNFPDAEKTIFYLPAATKSFKPEIVAMAENNYPKVSRRFP